ncbi:hypothetical protein ACVILH_005697 [Bradyrhizobium sp. USDA 4353]
MLQHQLEPRRRQRRIERQVGAAGADDGEQHHDAFDRALGRDTNDVADTDTSGDQPFTKGAARSLEFSIAQRPAVIAFDRYALTVRSGNRAEARGETDLAAGQRTLSLQQLSLSQQVGRRVQRQVGNVGVGCGQAGIEQMDIAAQPARRTFARKAIAARGQHQAQAILIGCVSLGQFDLAVWGGLQQRRCSVAGKRPDVKFEIEARGAPLEADDADVDTVKRERCVGRGLIGEARERGIGEQGGERRSAGRFIVRGIERSSEIVMNLAEQIDKLRRATAIGCDDQGVDMEADLFRQRGIAAARGWHGNDWRRAGRQTGDEQHLHRQQRGRNARPLLAGECAQARMQLRRKPCGQGVAVEAPAARADRVMRYRRGACVRQSRRCGLADRDRGASHDGTWRGLPSLVIQVRAIGRSQIAAENGVRPAVGDDVVDQVNEGVIVIGEADQSGFDERRLVQRDRLSREAGGEVARDGLALMVGDLRAIEARDLKSTGWGNDTDRLAIDVMKTGPQGGMRGDDIAEGRFKGGDVETARHAIGCRDIVGRLIRREAAGEPQPLLGSREARRIAQMSDDVVPVGCDGLAQLCGECARGGVKAQLLAVHEQDDAAALKGGEKRGCDHNTPASNGPAAASATRLPMPRTVASA